METLYEIAVDFDIFIIAPVAHVGFPIISKIGMRGSIQERLGIFQRYDGDFFLSVPRFIRGPDFEGEGLEHGLPLAVEEETLPEEDLGCIDLVLEEHGDFPCWTS